MATHVMFDGRLTLYKRGRSRFWQAAARVAGRRFRQSTKEEELAVAKDVAEDWYLDLRGKRRNGEIIRKEKLFEEAAKGYISELKTLGAATRSAKYIDVTEIRLNAHILPFFGGMELTSIKASTVRKYRVMRTEKNIRKTTVPAQSGRPEIKGKPPARSTMSQEIVIIRQVLKWAYGENWIPTVPDLRQPYMSQSKKGVRPWFPPEDYKKLYTATRRRIKEGTRAGWKSHYEDMHDYVLFMANSGLRPDEVKHLEFRDIEILKDLETQKHILRIEVRGKRGVGVCVTMTGAVEPFRRLKARRTREREEGLHEDGVIGDLLPEDKVFRKYKRHLFNQILDEEGLRYDRDGQARTAYSLRHTYISMRLLNGADVYQIAINCRTSVKMIEEHYGSHIKNRVNVSKINV